MDGLSGYGRLRTSERSGCAVHSFLLDRNFVSLWVARTVPPVFWLKESRGGHSICGNRSLVLVEREQRHGRDWLCARAAGSALE